MDVSAWMVLLTALAVSAPLFYWWRFRGAGSGSPLLRSTLLVVGFTASVVLIGRATL